MTAVLEAERLGKRYGSNWALKDCDFRLEEGQVAALVGPNGTGKSTLLELAVGLISPSAGEIMVLGASPTHYASHVLPRIGFVAQERPLYRSLTVDETLTLGRKLNERWDDTFARRRVTRLDLPLRKKVGQLSGGQQAQVALLLALAKRPALLLLDEPVAAFDPLARREFLQLLVETLADGDATVLLSSHILGDLERVCDTLLLLSCGRVALQGEIEGIVAAHRVVIGPVFEEILACGVHDVIQRSRSERQVSTLIRLEAPLVLGHGWSVHEPTLEDIVLAYLQRGAGSPAALKEEVLA